MFTIKKILLATDFSSYSNQAYFHAVALAEHFDAGLVILNVYDSSGNFGALDAENQAGTGTSSRGREYWRGQLEQIHPVNPQIAVEHVMLEGDPAESIIDYAAQAGADLIIMGT